MKSHQRVIRDRKAKEARESFLGEWWTEINLNLSSSTVKEVDKNLAKRIILEYEWLGTLSGHKFFGIFFDGHCGGVVCLGQNRHYCIHERLSKTFAVEQTKIWRMERGAVTHWSPPNTSSKLVSTALKLLRDEVGDIVVYAYADPEAGEIGTIYQACNWHCWGETNPKKQKIWIDPDGNEQNEKTVLYDMRPKTRSYKDQQLFMLNEGWTTRYPSKKYRYFIPLCNKRDKRRIRKEMGGRIISYPKRS